MLYAVPLGTGDVFLKFACIFVGDNVYLNKMILFDDSDCIGLEEKRREGV